MDKSMTIDRLILLMPRTKVEGAISRNFLTLVCCSVDGVESLTADSVHAATHQGQKLTRYRTVHLRTRH
jgi:hypothetical protein